MRVCIWDFDRAYPADRGGEVRDILLAQWKDYPTMERFQIAVNDKLMIELTKTQPNLNL